MDAARLKGLIASNPAPTGFISPASSVGDTDT